MKAMVIHEPGENGTLLLEEVPEPEPGPRDVLVAVRATALNRADLSARRGTYSQQATARGGPKVAGLESAGEVVAVGPEVTRFALGDRVMGQCSGGYAQLLAVDERLLMQVPEALDWVQAAATPVSLVTEHDAIATNAGIKPGESLLVQAAGSAVGLMAIQIARILGADSVFGTVASPEQARLVRELGVDVAIDHEVEDFVEVVSDKTQRQGVDIVIDHVGGAVLRHNLEVLKLDGRLVSVGRLGPTVGELDLDLLSRKRLHLIGVTFRTRTIDEYGDCVSKAASALMPALSSGELRPIVDSVYPLERALEAQERMSQNRHLGKIVLEVAGRSA